MNTEKLAVFTEQGIYLIGITVGVLMILASFAYDSAFLGVIGMAILAIALYQRYVGGSHVEN